MVNQTPLRHIKLSGGLFTNNLLVRLRDKPDNCQESNWRSFGQRTKPELDFFEVWAWAKRTYDVQFREIENWSADDRFSKWIAPLLQKLGHNFLKKRSDDGDSHSDEEGNADEVLDKIQITHHTERELNPILQVCMETNLDEKVENNYQKKSQHDLLQLYLLLQSKYSWGILTNGRIFRILGKFSNIYAKGYVEFDLENIILNRDEVEFRLFYTFLHVSRFDYNYGLDPSKWIRSLEIAVEKAIVMCGGPMPNGYPSQCFEERFYTQDQQSRDLRKSGRSR